MNAAKPAPILVRTFQAVDENATRYILALATRDLRKVYRRRDQGEAETEKRPLLGRWVAEERGRVIGVVEAYRQGGDWHLQGLAVDPERRRKGAARALIDHLLHLARESGVGRVTLSTIKETGNVSIFQRLGFAVETQAKSAAFETLQGGEVTQVDMYLHAK